MPLYDYRCRDCGHEFEIQQSISDDALTECPECAGDLRKVFSPVGISFKGSGFYKNDSRGSSGSSGGGSSSATTSSAGSGDNGSGDAGGNSGSSSAGTSGSTGGGSAPDSTSSAGSGSTASGGR